MRICCLFYHCRHYMVKLPYHSGKEKEKKKTNILGDVKNQITISSRIQEIKKN